MVPAIKNESKLNVLIRKDYSLEQGLSNLGWPSKD